MKPFTTGLILCLSTAAAAQDPYLLTPEQDTWVSSAQPDASFGSDLILSVEEDAVSLHERAYLKFDTSALAGKTIVSARLRVWVQRENSGGGSADDLEVLEVLSPWTESLTWTQSEALSVGPVADAQRTLDYGTTNDVDPPQPFDFELPALTQAWADGAPNEGVMIRLKPGSKADFRLASGESSPPEYRPMLVVAALDAPPPPPPPPPPPSSGSGAVGSDGENGDVGINDKCGCGTASPRLFGAGALVLGLILLLSAGRRP